MWRKTFCNKECMAYVDRVVHAESDGKDNVDAGDDVNSDLPEMKEPNNISEGENHNQDDHDTDLNIAEKEKSNNENTDHSQPNVPP